MTDHEPRFSLNHILCPQYDIVQYCDLAVRVGIDAIELRNDIGPHSIKTIQDAQHAGRIAQSSGLKVLSINALQQFNHWTDERRHQAETLIEQVVAANGQYLVMCPVNLESYKVDSDTGYARLKESLESLKPLLDSAGIKGLIEPLGFPISSLRTKREAADIISSMNSWDSFGLLQDTFHHYVASENEAFPEHTELVHISGVETTTVERNSLQDSHRVLVGPKDISGNIQQASELFAGGYEGYLSFEPFAPSIQTAEDHLTLLRESIKHMTQALTINA